MALTDAFIKTLKVPANKGGDKHSDGGGLYLHHLPTGKYWRMAYRFTGKQRTLAIGIYPTITMAMARRMRDDAKLLLAQGVDPSAEKRLRREAKENSEQNTFELVARQWLAKPDSSRKAITLEKLTRWLDLDVFPFIGTMPMQTITAKIVLEQVLTRIEARNAIDKAHRVKALCGQIFRFAIAKGILENNPIPNLQGALSTKKSKSHGAITDPKALGGLLRAIGGYEGHPVIHAALKLSPMLFVRPGELRQAEWSEFDLSQAEWRIPASKMKMGVDHLVPLATQALAVLAELKPLTGHGRYLFPNLRTGERPMSENTVNAVLRGLGFSGEVHTGHGFRATARTIMDEVLNERVDLIEHQLAHAVKDANGNAYNRTAHMPARRLMMQRWADYLDELRAKI
jgi:integrase